MAITLKNTYVDTYDSMVTTLAQQERSLLLAHVMVRSQKSKNHRFTTVGSVNMTSTNKSSGTFATRTATTYTDTPWGGRLVGVKLGRIADTMEIHDESQMNGIISAPSNITRAHGYAAGRQFDDWIIAAATGTATGLDGKAIAFPAAQKVSVDISGDVKMNAEWWASVLEKYAANNASGAAKIVVVPPILISHMYGINEYKSKDYTYNPLEQLMGSGLLPNWMGFMWILSTRLLSTNSNKNTSAFVFQSMSIGLKLNMGLMASIDKMPTHWNMYQFMCQLMADAVRIEDNRVMHLDIKHTA